MVAERFKPERNGTYSWFSVDPVSISLSYIFKFGYMLGSVTGSKYDH